MRSVLDDTSGIPLALSAGRLSGLFDPQLGALRYVRLDGREVVRAVYAAVRDRAWNTIAPRISAISVREEAGASSVSYRAHAVGGDVDFAWDGRIDCRDDGTIHITFDGEAGSTFWRNRIGLCVLHPIDECAGQPCTVMTSRGEISGRFPTLIAPHQPFLDVHALEYAAGSGARLRIVFAGDVFETEDQRNWGDASFKTYSTPLSRPIPVRIERGTRIRQAVTLRLCASQQRARLVRPKPSAKAHVVRVGGAERPLPAVGLSLPADAPFITGRDLDRLRALQLSHLRAEIRVADARWPTGLQAAADTARALRVPLQVALCLSADHEHDAARLAEHADWRSIDVSLWLVLQEHAACTTPEAVAHLAARLRTLAPAAPVAAGTVHNFAELNRHRDIAGGQWWPGYPLSPLAHLSDTSTLIENIGAQADTVRTVRSFSPHPVVVGPVSLRPRRFVPDGARGELPDPVDSRQSTLLAAGWTIGSLNQLLRAEGLHSVTYFDTTGRRGVLESEASRVTDPDAPSTPGTVFPVYHVFADLAAATGTRRVAVDEPLTVAALALTRIDGSVRLLVANLTPVPRAIAVSGLGGPFLVRYLDPTTAAIASLEPERFAVDPGAAASSTFDLAPWSVARIESFAVGDRVSSPR